MASRKRALTVGDLDRWTPKYRQQYMQSRAVENNKKARADAAIQSIAEENPNLSEDQMAEIYSALMAGEDFDIPESRAEQFRDVVSTASDFQQTTPTLPASSGEGQGMFGAFVDLAQGSGYRSLAGLAEQQARFSGIDKIDPSSPVGAILDTIGVGPSVARLTRERADANLAARADWDRGLEGRSGFTTWAGTAVADAAESGASGAVSLLGGPAGMIAVGDAYAQAYREGLEGGLEGADLEAWAWSQAAPEGIAVIPAGKVVERIPVLGPLLKRKAAEATAEYAARITGRTARIGGAMARTGAGEYAEEFVTDLTQSAAQTALANQKQSQALADFAATQAPGGGDLSLEAMGEALASAHRAGSAGLVMGLGGGTIAGVRDARNYTRELEAQGDANVLAGAAHSEAAMRGRGTPLDPTAPAPVQEDMFGAAPEGTPSFEEQEAARQRQLEEDVAYQQRARERTREENREGLRNNLQRTVDERAEEVARIENDIEEGDTTSQTFNALTDARASLAEAEQNLSDFDSLEPQGTNRVSPAPAEEGMPPVQRDFVQDQELQRQGEAAESIQKRRQDRAKKEAAATAKAEKAAEKQQEAERTARMDRLIEQYPDESSWQLAERLERGEGAAPQQAKKPAPKRRTKAKPTPQAEQATPEPTKNDADLTEEDSINEAYRAAKEAGFDVPDSLSMADDAEVAPEAADFVKKAAETIRNLTRKNTKPSVDVQNLIRQGKVVLVPNAQSVGLESNSAAEYVPSDNKMYIYTDKLDPKDTAGALIRAFHESGHAGQFNARDGRAGAIKSLLDAPTDAAAKIREQATRGNSLAQEAVRKAAADTDARRDRGEANPARNEDLEVVAYLIGEAMAARGKPLGGVRNILNDLRAGGKELLRKNLGVELDVTYDDLVAATKDVAGEIVQTDMSAPRYGSNLSMIVGPNSANWDSMKRKYRGRVDNKERAEIADGDATLNLNDAMVRRLLNSSSRGGSPVTLGELLNHPALYAAYPADAEVAPGVAGADLGIAATPVVARKYSDNTEGSWDGLAISLSEQLINDAAVSPIDAMDDLRSVLLHEVQHAVQEREGFVGGANPRAFVPRDVKSAYTLSAERFEGFLKNFEVGLAEKTLNPSQANRWRAELNRAGNPTDPRTRSRLFLDGLFADDSRSPIIKRAGARYKQVKENLGRDRAAYLDATRAGFETYIRDYGEGEARNTQSRRHFTEDQLDAMPMPEDTMGIDESGITVDQMVDTAPLARARKALPPASQRRYEELAAKPLEDMTVDEQVEYTNLRSQATPARESLSMADPAAQQVPAEKLSPKERAKRAAMSGTRQQTSDIKIAEALDGEYRSALLKDFGETDVSPEMHEKIVAALQDKGALAEIRKIAPNLAEVLDAARTQMDANTNDLIQSIVGSGVRMSPEDAKLVKTLLQNRGKYLTRAYNAFQGKAGREWSSTRMENFDKYLNAFLDENKRDRLSKRSKWRDRFADVSAVKDALDFFKSKYQIPDNDTLADMSNKELEAIARDYGVNVKRLPYDDGVSGPKTIALVNELADIRDSISEGQLDNMARRAVEGMLGITKNMPHYAKVMSDLARDPGTLKKKDFVPDEIRNLLGEMTNPGARILTTLATQAALLSRQGVYVDLIKNHKGTLVVPGTDIDKPGVRDALTQKSRLGDRPPMQLESSDFGPLEGWWVHPRVYDALTAVNETYTSTTEALDNFAENPSPLAKIAGNRLGKLTGAVTTWEKITGVVLNPARLVSNYMGSGLQMISNGNTNFGSVVKGHKGAASYVKSSTFGGTSEILNEAYRYVNLEAADIANIQHILGNSIQDYMDGKIGRQEIENKFADAIKKGLSSTGELLVGSKNFATSAYAAADNWTKIANFYDRVRVLEEYYAITDPKRPKEEIKQEAGNTVNYTNISYERVPEALKVFEGVGLTKFIPYFYEAYRTRLTNYHQAYLDAERASRTDDPKAARVLYTSAVKRFVGNTVATGLMPFAAAMRIPGAHAIGGIGFGLLAAAGGEDDHELMRRMVSAFSREQELLNFGTNENGDPVFLSFSDYFDPYGPANDMVRLFANTPLEDTPEAMKNMLVDMLITPSWLNTSYKLLTGGSVPESSLSDIFPDQVQATQDAVNSFGVDPVPFNTMLKLAESWVPGMLKAQASYSKPEIANSVPIDFGGVQIPGMRDTAELATAMNKAGFRFETLNPGRQLNEYGYETKDLKSSNRRNFTDTLTMDRNLTKADLEDAVMKYAVAEIDRLRDDYQNVRSMRRWGYSDEHIAASLKASKGWGKDEIEMLMDGEASPILSMKSIKDRAEARLSGMAESQKPDYTERVNRALDMIDSNKASIESMGVIVKEK